MYKTSHLHALIVTLISNTGDIHIMKLLFGVFILTALNTVIASH